MAVTQDYQMEYSVGGETLAMGPSGSTPNVDLVRVTGLHDLEVRDGDRAFARYDGDVAGLHRAEPRYVRLEMEVRGVPGDSAYDELAHKAIRMFTRRERQDGVLTFQFPGTGAQFIRCRPVRRRVPREAKTEYGLLPIDVELKAADPRIYDAIVSSGVQSGTFNVVNNGNDYAYPIFNFGAVAAAKITNNTNGDIVDIQGATGSGNLMVDMDRFIRGVFDLIVYRGSTDNYPAWQQPRKPFRLEPGTNSLTLNVGTNVTVQHYPTYL